MYPFPTGIPGHMGYFNPHYMNNFDPYAGHFNPYHMGYFNPHQTGFSEQMFEQTMGQQPVSFGHMFPGIRSFGHNPFLFPPIFHDRGMEREVRFDPSHQNRDSRNHGCSLRHVLKCIDGYEKIPKSVRTVEGIPRLNEYALRAETRKEVAQNWNGPHDPLSFDESLCIVRVAVRRPRVGINPLYPKN